MTSAAASPDEVPVPPRRAEGRPDPVVLGSARMERTGVADRIVEDLRDRIARGEIAHGARLPSEKALGAGYGVSPTTAREAVRALSAMGLVEVRHGSGTYVVADAQQLVTAALATALQLEAVSIGGVIELLALINERAVSLAVEAATPEDLDRLDAAEQAIATGASPQEILAGVGDFLTALVTSAHEPVVALVGTFLVRVLVRLQVDLLPEDHQFWRELTGPQDSDRDAVIAALRQRDAEGARAAVRRYHGLARERVVHEHDGAAARLSDARFASSIADLISDRR